MIFSVDCVTGKFYVWDLELLIRLDQCEKFHNLFLPNFILVRYDRVKKKGYVRLVTNQGNLNLELHCDLVRKSMPHPAFGMNLYFLTKVNNFNLL